MSTQNKVVARRIIEQEVELNAPDMALILDYEYDRRVTKSLTQGLRLIQENIGDLVELTGSDLEHFNFEARAGQLARVTAITHHGYVGEILVVDHEGDFITQKYLAGHVRRVSFESGEHRNKLN